MAALRTTAIFLVCGIVLLASVPAAAQKEQDARALVQSVVNNELEKDANDHSKWMYRDVNKEHGTTTVKLVVQTSHGDLSKTLEIDGHPLTEQQKQQDRAKMHRFVTDAAVRQKQKQSSQQDDQKATALTRMLPDAFLWTKESQNGDETTLSFRPNPKFNPSTRDARVFAAMQGTMVVNTEQKRIQSLKGRLTRNVNFGWGLLGRLEKGGTFDVERTDIGNGVWEITGTHVHIHGHALIFKTISEDQDEETSHYHPTPASTTLAEAEKMLEEGKVAKELGVKQP